MCAKLPNNHSNVRDFVLTYLRFTMQEFGTVGGYTENLTKPQNCQNLGVGICAQMGACLGQYGTYGIQYELLL